MANISSGEFQINDVVLKIPPEQIHIERRSVNHKWQTLRTRSSIKVKSGFSLIDISFSAKFTDTLDTDNMNGYDQLQMLVAQFRCTPFCYVQNRHLRNAILGSDNQQTMALALRQMEVRKTAESTNVIEVFFSFSWFNYFPFSRNFSFKTDIFIPDEQSDPMRSKAWRKLWRAEHKRGKYAPLRSSQLGTGQECHTSISFRQLAQLAQGKYEAFNAERVATSEMRELLEKSGSDGMGFDRRTFDERTRKQLGESHADQFFATLSEASTSMFEQEELSNEQLLDVINSPIFGSMQAQRFGLPGGSSAGDWTVALNNEEKPIKFKSDPVLKKDPKKKEDTSKDLVTLTRPVRLSLNEKGIIATGISISFENVLATMPVIGHPYPTFQHTGSIDAVVTISMMTTGDLGVQSLTELYSVIESQAFKYRMAPQGQRNIWVTDPLINACGLYEFIPESLVFDTVPGQPGTTAANLVLSDSPLSAYQREEIIPMGSFMTTQMIRNEISEILLNNLEKKEDILGDLAYHPRLRQYWQLYNYSPKGEIAPNDYRNQRFKDICNEYGKEFGELLQDLYKMMRNALPGRRLEKFSKLFSLSEDYTLEFDYVPGILRLIPDLFHHIKQELGDVSAQLNTTQAGPDSLLSRAAAAVPGTIPIAIEVETVDPSFKTAMDKALRNRLEEWLKWSTKFLDSILLSGHIELDQFESIRDIMAQNGIGSSGHCYPDFPLTQVVDSLEEDGSPAYPKLKDLATRLQLLQKKLPISCLVGPDFYFYNDTDTKQRLITSEIMTKAKEGVLASLKEMETAEETWVEGGYKDKYIGQRGDRVKTDLVNEGKDAAFWSSEDPKQEEVAEAMRKLVKGSGVFAPDDLQGDESVYSSLAGSRDSGQDISSYKISETPITDMGNAIGVRRDAQTMSPQGHYAEVQHRFGADAIDFVNAASMYPSISSDPNKGPQEWSWPTSNGGSTKISSPYGKIRTKISKTPHKGIDIVSRKGPSETVKLDVLAAADGKIIRVLPKEFGLRKSGKKLGDKELSVGTVIVISHDDDWETVYKHMPFDDKFKKIHDAFYPKLGAKKVLKVERGDILGTVGTTGYSTGPHLHFETKYKDGRYDPDLVLAGRYTKNQGPVKTIDPSNDSLLTRCVDQLEKDLVNGQAYTMARAYPTFRLYFIESDMGERTRFAFDDFFSYSSVKDIRLIRNRKIAADLCMLQLTNISGALSHRKFKGGVEVKPDEDPKEIKQSPQRTNTAEENRIGSLMLQPGVQIQLRLGYNNNPEELERVFNGVITDVQFSETDDLVNITCQSFAIELAQIMKGEKKKSFGGFLSSSGRTACILEELLTAPETVHFGRWSPADSKSNYSKLLGSRWEFSPKPYDDNIFAPTGRGWKGLWDSTPEFVAEETTIWDVFQEMTLRHPGYIACAVPYEGKFGPRMTMFFGCPEQPYFARGATHKEENTANDFKEFIKEAQEEEKKHKDTTPEELQDSYSTPHGPIVKEAMDKQRDNSYMSARDFWLNKLLKNYALDKGIVKPFRSYHVLTSTLHILYNNITSSSYECFNTATVRYKQKHSFFLSVMTIGLSKLISGDYDTFTLKCEMGLPDEDVREVFTQYDNCIGYEMAKRYAVGTLFRAMKEGYKGSMIVIGNPTIKPYDICYIFDEYTDMFGPIEVEQVVHHLSQETGFTTEITPDMVVHVNRLSTLSTVDAMGLAAETALKKIGMQSLPGLGADSSKAAKVGKAIIEGSKTVASVGNTILEYSFAPIANMFFNSTEHALGEEATTHPGGLLGVFIFRKLLTRSQLAHPFRYSPLVKSGMPMLGGVPTKKTDGSFITAAFKWFKEAQDGVPLWLEDSYDRIHPRNWWSSTWGDIGRHITGTEEYGKLR